MANRKKTLFIIFFIFISILIFFKIEKRESKFISYPTKNVKVIVAYKEGGGTDLGARLLVKEAEKYFPKHFEIINILGKDGNIGYQELLSAKGDGYTIGFINFPSFLSLSLRQKTKFKKEDMEIILNHVFDPAVLVVNSNSKWKNFKDFLEEVKSKPDILTISNNGVGLSNHLGAAYFAYVAGIKVTHVPFNGSADMITALKKGYVDATVAKISEVSNLVKNGEFRILTSFTEKRLENFKDIPTAKEYGFDVVFGSSRALVAPKGTPKDILNILHQTFKTALYSKENIEKSKELNLPIKYVSPEDMKKYILKEEEYIKNIIPKLEI